MKKKIVSLLLALTMMVSLLPVQVLAAGDGGAADALLPPPYGKHNDIRRSAYRIDSIKGIPLLCKIFLSSAACGSKKRHTASPGHAPAYNKAHGLK